MLDEMHTNQHNNIIVVLHADIYKYAGIKNY